jgi:hypothetical protein
MAWLGEELPEKDQDGRTPFAPRCLKDVVEERDETIRGHVFCSFLALVLKTALEERIAALGRSGSWPEIIADLNSLTEAEISYDSKRFVVRSPPRFAASLALRAAGRRPTADRPRRRGLLTPAKPKNVVPSRRGGQQRQCCREWGYCGL